MCNTHQPRRMRAPGTRRRRDSRHRAPPPAYAGTGNHVNGRQVFTAHPRRIEAVGPRADSRPDRLGTTPPRAGIDVVQAVAHDVLAHHPTTRGHQQSRPATIQSDPSGSQPQDVAPRTGVRPISSRNRTDLGTGFDRSRRGTRPISASGRDRRRRSKLSTTPSSPVHADVTRGDATPPCRWPQISSSSTAGTSPARRTASTNSSGS